MTVQEKLLAVQQDLKAPKGQFNAFGKYKYRSCEDILEALKPILGKNKAVLTISDRIELMGDRHYIVATATFTDVESGETVCVTAQAREEEAKKGMDASQVTGAASSYARKYALNGLFCIDDTKDSDATNTGGRDEPLPPGPPCAKCKKEILPHNTGKTIYTAQQVADRTSEAYGAPLCWSCAAQAKAAGVIASNEITG